jgi:hypothetical protein
MSVRVKKYPQLKTILEKGPQDVAVPEHLPKLPMLLLASAVRGSGKSTSISSMLKHYKNNNLCHRVFVISPTYRSNEFLFKDLVAEEDVYEDATQGALDKIIAEVESEAKEWKHYKENKLIWERFRQQKNEYIMMRRKNIDEDLLAAALDAGLADLDSLPPYKFPGTDHPQMWLIIDDCQSSPLFNPSTKVKGNLSNISIKHRHIGGDRFGLNMVVALQNWRSNQGSLSKAIRQNQTCLMLWGLRDSKMLDDIYAEIGRDVSKEQFYAAFNYCTSGERWNYMFLEFTPKLRIRRNLDEVLNLDSFSVKEPAEPDVEPGSPSGSSGAGAE